MSKDLQAQIETLTADNATLRTQANELKVEAEINEFYRAGEPKNGMRRVVKTLARECIDFGDGTGSPKFTDSAGNRLHSIHRVKDWLNQVSTIEGIDVSPIAKADNTSQPTRLCKSNMSEGEKAEYKKTHGYPAYNALPYADIV